MGSEASVFWCPRQCPHVLPVTAERPARSPDKEVLDLGALPCRISILLTRGEDQHVLFEDRHRSLQLAVAGAACLLKPARLTSSALWLPAELRQRLIGLECLNAVRSAGRLPSKYFPAEPRRARLRLVMRALDGSVTGAAHREIGICLFGKPAWTATGRIQVAIFVTLCAVRLGEGACSLMVDTGVFFFRRPGLNSLCPKIAPYTLWSRAIRHAPDDSE